MTFHVTTTLSGLGDPTWDNTLELARTHGGWRVQFHSSTVYPLLQSGEVLRRSQPLTSRGDLADRHSTPIRAASADLAANVLGSRKADKTGLERIYDAQLMGSSGATVDLVDLSTGQVIRTVKEFPPHRSQPVTTTLDVGLQRAAEAALQGASEPAALVVLDTTTGEIRAVGNRPVVGLPAAFRDEAPGLTFKVVVPAAAPMNGFSPASMVNCPAKAVFGGKEFHNDEPLAPRKTWPRPSLCPAIPRSSTSPRPCPRAR